MTLEQVERREGQFIQIVTRCRRGLGVINLRALGVEVRQAQNLVETVRVAVASKPLHELREAHVTLASDHVIGVLERLMRHKGDVRAAEQHRNTGVAALLRVGVALNSGVGGGGDAHQVGTEHILPVNLYSADQLAVDSLVKIWVRVPRDGREQGQAQLGQVRDLIDRRPTWLWLDVPDLHSNASYVG